MAARTSSSPILPAHLADPEKEKSAADGPLADDVSGGHGSGVAGIIGADADDGGPAGVASVLGDKLTISNTNLWGPEYGQSWVPAEPDPDDPTVVTYPGGGTYQYSSLVAIMKQVEAGSTVINMSWGPKNPALTDPEVPKLFRAFYERMAREHPEVVFVAAAGNHGQAADGSQMYPGGFDLPNVITVGNVVNDGTVWKSSNTPGNNFEVSIYAPGHQAVRGYNKDTGEVKNLYGGTSMASPQVAATAALLRSLNKSLTAAQIKDIITRAATSKNGTPVLSRGRGGPGRHQPQLRRAGHPADRQGDAARPRRRRRRGGSRGRLARRLHAARHRQGDRREGRRPGGRDRRWRGEERGRADAPRRGGRGDLDGRARSARGGRDHRPALGQQGREPHRHRDDRRQWVLGRDLHSHLFTLDPAMEEKAREEGCDVAILQGLLGKPLPMTLDLSVDPDSSGTSTYWIDVSSLTDADGASMTSEPQEAPVSYKGNLLTFTLDGSSGVATRMSGAVSRSGQVVTINGTITISGEGYSARAVWTVTRAGA